LAPAVAQDVEGRAAEHQHTDEQHWNKNRECRLGSPEKGDFAA
jgi:hypothetical protein